MFIVLALRAVVGLGSLVLPGAAQPTGIERLRPDPNTARPHELAAVPGLGRRRAFAIVLHRVRHGRFSDLSALKDVDGIGPKTIAALAAHLEIRPPGPAR